MRIAPLRAAGSPPSCSLALVRTGVQTPFSFNVRQDPRVLPRATSPGSAQSGLGLPGPRLLPQAGFQLPGDPRRVPAVRGNALPPGRPARPGRRRRGAWSRWKRSSPRATGTAPAAATARPPTTWKTAAELDRLTPGFSWTRFLPGHGRRADPGRRGVAAGLPAGDGQHPGPHPAPGGEAVPRLQGAGRRRGQPCRAPSRRPASTSATGCFPGPQAPRPRWDRAVGAVNRSAGRGRRQALRGQALPARGQGAHAGAGENLCAAFPEGIDGLDWMSPATDGGAGEAGQLQHQDRLPRALARLLQPGDPARRSGGQPAARQRVPTARSASWASRWIAASGR